jgi:hypothetical protein
MKEVEDILRGCADAKDKGFFDSIATLMTNLLRGVVERSAGQFCQLFTRFTNAADMTFAPDQIASVLNLIQSDRTEPGLTPIFAIKLVVQRRKIQLQVFTNEVEATIGRIFNSILNALDALPRIETKLYPLTDRPKTLALKMEDERIGALKDEIIRAFRQSMGSALSVVALYDEHAYLMDESPRLADWVTQPRTLNEFRDR